MSTTHSRIPAILLPGDGGPGEGGDDAIDVTAHISNNLSLLANLVGAVRFTTAAGKPTSNNYDGKVAFEIDTSNLFFWDGDSWEILPGSIFRCTAATRPTTGQYAGMLAGQVIYETDTKAYGIYDSTGPTWRMYDTVWQTESNGAKFTHSGAGGMTGNTCIIKYMRFGKSVEVSWNAATTAGTNYGVHGNILLGLPTGLIADTNGIPRGICRSSVGNVGHHGQMIFPAGDGSQLFCVYCTNTGSAEAYITSNGSVAGNWITAEAWIELA